MGASLIHLVVFAQAQPQQPPPPPNGFLRILALVVGALLVMAAAADALNTLVSTRIRLGERWPSDYFYSFSWWFVKRAGGGFGSPERRESFHSFFGPVSLLGLLVMWVVTQILGWGLIWWALQHQMTGVDTYLDGVYYAGVSYFTVGFGDVVPQGGTARLLTLLEAFIGVGTTALVIGYLPVLYSAYSTREALLLSLDDFTGDRITPVALIEAHAPGGDLQVLNEWFHEWERWCSGVLESHTSYPMLMLFRSQHPGQSWITALGVVTDAATLVLASVDTTHTREALMLYRRATRTLTLLGQRLRLEPSRPDPLREDFFGVAYRRMEAVGLPLRPFDQSWADLLQLRSAYGPWLESLIDHLVAPRGFWGHAIETPAVEGTRTPAERLWGADGPPVAGGGSSSRYPAPGDTRPDRGGAQAGDPAATGPDADADADADGSDS